MSMNFRLSKNLSPATDSVQKIYSLSWSPNSFRLAIAQSSDKKIILFDENGIKKEAFSTKSFKGSKNYTIKDICFSPCSTKLAIAQSDNIIFVYNLGLKWGDKKTICNKFEQEAQVSCMIWPNSKQDIFVGLINGKIKVCYSNKTQTSATLYACDSFVVSLSCSIDGKYLLSGHLDGTVFKFSFDKQNLQKFVVHSTIPYCLSYGNDILVCGMDSKVTFYNENGVKLQTFDYSNDEKLKEFTRSVSNLNGDCIAVGNYNKFFVYMFNKRKQQWEEAYTLRI